MFFPEGKGGEGMKLNTHLYRRLRMCGVLSLLPFYVFIACTGTNFG
jgi:hypothetical protein